MKIKNFTPHDITIYEADKVIATIPSSGIGRVQQREEIVESINNIPVVKVVYGDVEGLPKIPDEGTQYIVSVFVANALKASDSWSIWREHLLVPNSGPTKWGAVRDESGRIMGVRSLIRP